MSSMRKFLDVAPIAIAAEPNPDGAGGIVTLQFNGLPDSAIRYAEELRAIAAACRPEEARELAQILLEKADVAESMR